MKRQRVTALVRALMGIALPLSAAPAGAQQAPTGEPPHDQAVMQMSSTDGAPKEARSDDMAGMDMSGAEGGQSMNMSMQGGKAPKDARDPNAYADGYEYSTMPGLEQVDRLAVRRVFVEQAEGTYRDPGGGGAWDMQAWYGPDEQKLWLRTEGSVDSGRVGATTTGEALWWRAFAPFWATQLGVRQDIGAGAHTYAAAGVQGLAPYWFEVEATGYVGEDGRLSARFKASYEVLFTNRLILTPKIETNLYSRGEPKRDLGAGVGNVELGLRLRYEIRRKVAPYIGYVWDRALGDTADRLRAAGKTVTDRRIVGGVRIWF